MIAPPLYNMLLYRAFHARRAQCDLLEANYQTQACAFGHVPIVIYLGDFLQLKPTGSGRSLLSDLRLLEGVDGDRAPPAEHQQAMRLFCKTPFSTSDSTRSHERASHSPTAKSSPPRPARAER